MQCFRKKHKSVSHHWRAQGEQFYHRVRNGGFEKETPFKPS